MLALDETLRFLESYPPREIIIHYNKKLDNQINNLKYDDILSYLNISAIFLLYLNLEIKKIGYQKELLDRIFKNDSQLDTIDLLDLIFN